MKLWRVQVQNFRSIVDSGIVDVDEKVTVVIGKNEQGKTNFLKGIASYNSKVAYAPSDLPNHLLAILQDKKHAEIPVVTLWLVLDSSEKATLKSTLPDIDEVTEFKTRRYFDGHYEYWKVKTSTEADLRFQPPNTAVLVEDIKRHAETLKTKLATHAGRLTAFADALPQAQSHIDQFLGAQYTDATQIDNITKTFATALRALPGQDAAIEEDVTLAVKEIQQKLTEIQHELQKDPAATFRDAIPQFLFHSALLDKVPNVVTIADFVKNPETTSKGMTNLCQVAGLTMQRIQQLAGDPDRGQREVFEDHHQAMVSGGINKSWTQETYHVHFRIDQDRLYVFIRDDTYGRRIPPLDRSDGFQWFLSFYTALLSEVSPTSPAVLLLDNPGLELHADGQRDIKTFLEERLPGATQVIYVTHSPAMIDPYNLEQVRQVELLGGMQGTKVTALKFKPGEDFDLLEPVRSAIGASLASSLLFNHFNILVEGRADKPILEGAFEVLHPGEAKRILVNGSVAENSGLLPQFYQRAGLPVAIYVDADSGGRALQASLKTWGIPEGWIVDLRTLCPANGQKDYELEDLLSSDFYYTAVKEAYPEHPVDKQDADAKRTKRYEDEFRQKHDIGFNKRRVGEAVKKLLQKGKVDQSSQDRLKELTDLLLGTLKKQVKQPTPANS